MAQHFDLELSMREPPESAQAHAEAALKEPARAVGLRLKKRGDGELDFRPPVGFPFLVNLWRHLDREQMTVSFAPGQSGGTDVTISGAVARGKHALAANAEHWSEALGASPGG